MRLKGISLIVLILLVSCRGSNGGSDAPFLEAKPATMFDNVTIMGQKVQSNGYEYSSGELDDMFNETMSCLGTEDIPSDIFIELKEPYSAFPCVPISSGCGGLFDFDNGEPVITVTADMIRLKHEYVHYMLDYDYGDADSYHETDSFDKCS